SSGLLLGQKYADCATAVISYDKVELAVGVYIRHGDAAGTHRRGEVLFGGEGAIAVAQQHAHRVAAFVRHRTVRYGKIQLAVAIDVRHRDEKWTGEITGRRAKVLPSGEGAIAVAEQH